MPSRRKFIVSTVAAGLVGGAGTLIARGDRAPAYMWRGAALGGEARVAPQWRRRRNGLNSDGHLYAPSRDLSHRSHHSPSISASGIALSAGENEARLFQFERPLLGTA
jgi:hypothetical protein